MPLRRRPIKPKPPKPKVEHFSVSFEKDGQKIIVDASGPPHVVKHGERLTKLAGKLFPNVKIRAVRSSGRHAVSMVGISEETWNRIFGKGKGKKKKKG